MNAEELHSQLLLYGARDVVLTLIAVGAWLLLKTLVLRNLRPPLASAAQPLWRKLLAGVAWALGALILSVVPVWIGQGYAAGPGWHAFAHSLPPTLSNGSAIWSFFALQALYEELLFRVIGLGILAALLFWLASLLLSLANAQGRSSLLRWAWFACGTMANLALVIVFAGAHSRNPGINSLSLINIGLAGLALGQLFWMQGAVTGAWSMHLVWNAGLATLGLPVSGIALTAPLFGVGFTGARAGAFSGGSFGPEGSVVCTAALTLIWVAMLWRTLCGARLVPPADSDSQLANHDETDGRLRRP